MGLVLQLAGILIAIPIGMGFVYGENTAIITLFVTSFTFYFFGFFLNAFSIREELSIQQSCVLITSVFFILGIIGAIPYFWLNIFNDTNLIERFINSFFESISGFTTTGFSLIVDSDKIPRSIMFYHSFTHFIGGLGVVFILLAFFYNGKTLDNMTKVMNFMRVNANIKRSLVAVLLIYSTYIIVFSIIMYLLGASNIANTVSIVLSALMTGGFSPTSDFKHYIDFPMVFIVIIMMIFGAISFNIHYNIIHGKFKSIFTKEFIVFILISVAGVLIMQRIYPFEIYSTIFHIFSASTGTGFSTLNFSLIPESAKFLFLILMFIGGMSLSTSGGIKVFRFILFFKSISFVLDSVIGKEIDSIEFEGKKYDKKDIIINMVFILLSISSIIITVILLTSSGFSFIDSMFEAVSAFATTGLSVGIVSIALAIHLKFALIFLMVIGRIEIITFLLIFKKQINN